MDSRMVEERELSSEEKYIKCVATLYKLTLMIGGRNSVILEWNTYFILHTYNSPLRALWRHACYVAWSWWSNAKAVLRMRLVWFWYRTIRRWSEERTLDHYDEMLDRQAGGGDEWDGVEEAIAKVSEKIGK